MTTLNDEDVCSALIPAIEQLFDNDLTEAERVHSSDIPGIVHARDMSIELAKNGGIKTDLLKRIVFPDIDLPNSEDEIITGVRRFLENFVGEA